MTSGNAAILPEILRRVVDAYRPVQVYLFGSEARGDADADSDTTSEAFEADAD